VGMARLLDRHLPGLPEGDLLTGNVHGNEDGVVVHVHPLTVGKDCRSLSLCGSMCRCLDETYGLLHAKRE